jgi:soluble lytic murein transglycosylase
MRNEKDRLKPHPFLTHRMFALLALGILVGCMLPVNTPPPSSLGNLPTLTPTMPSTLTPVDTLAPTQPPSPESSLSHAEYLLLEGNWPEAESAFQIALAAGVEPARSSIGLARTLHSKGDQTGAIETLTRLLDSQPPATYIQQANFLLGEIYNAQSQWDLAAAAYQEALRIGPRDLGDILQDRSGDALFAAGHPDQAAQAYASAALIAPTALRPALTEKEADAMRAAGAYEAALQLYDSLLPQVVSDTARARLQRKAGLTLIGLDRVADAHNRYQTALQYPTGPDAYLCLTDLLDAGVSVDEFQRGSVDYYAGQLDGALAAFSRFLAASPNSPGPALYFRGLTYRRLHQTDAALQDLANAIQLGQATGIWEESIFQKALIEWADKDDYAAGWETLVAFVDTAPNHPRAAEALFEGARIAERGNNLSKAAELWKRLADTYPSATDAPDARHLAGISLFRQNDFLGAESAFRFLTNSSDPETKARAWFWIAKTKNARGDSSGEKDALQKASAADPTGYYSLRAADSLAGRAPFTPPATSTFNLDLVTEYAQAADWTRQHLITPATPLPSPPDEATAKNDARLAHGRLLWDLGLYTEAESKFTELRTANANNPMGSLFLSQYFEQIGYYPGAIYAARQTLDAIGILASDTFAAPAYFNHIRFGPYFLDIVLPAGQNASLDPNLLFALIRQESMFGGNATSSSAALGLMQLIPSTARDIAKRKGLENLADSDLYRPIINVPLGTAYLALQRDSFGGDLFLALAAYNGGPGNALAWQALANGDDDLLVEVIRYAETRLYIRHIYEYDALYRSFYAAK